MHEFVLILSGFSALTEDIADAIFEAGCDDGTLCVRDGIPYIVFSRGGETLLDAIVSAIHDVESAGIEVRVVRVEPDDLVNASEIARRVGRSRENIHQLRTGTRGPGDFPAPVSAVTGKCLLWRWSDVAEWFATRYCISGFDAKASQGAKTIASINDILDLRRHHQSLSSVTDLWRRLRARRQDSTRSNRAS